MPLAQESRIKLNSVIDAMKQNNEDEDSIRDMVVQFKAKYDIQEEEEEYAPLPFGKKIPIKTQEKHSPGVAAIGGLIEGASFGATNLIPGWKESFEEVKKDQPIAAGAGEVASFFVPGTGQARAFKGAGKLAAKVIPKVAKETIKRKVGRKAFEGAAGGLITEGARGATETGELDVVRGIKKGLKAVPAGALIGGAFEAVSPVLKNRAVKFLQSSIKPGKKVAAKGFEAENLLKHKVTGMTYGNTINKAQKKIKIADKELDKLLKNFVEKNPTKKIDVDIPFIQVIDDIDKGKIKKIFGAKDEAAAIAEIDDMFKSLAKRGLSGEINVKELRKVKNLIGQKAFKNSRGLTEEDKVKIKAAKVLYISLLEKMNTLVPEAGKQNKIMSDLLPTIPALEDAIHRTSNKNFFSLRDFQILAGGGMASTFTGSPLLGTVTVGAVAGKKMAEQGRGALALEGVSKFAGKQAARRGFTGIAGKAIPEEEEEKRPRFTGTGLQSL